MAIDENMWIDKGKLRAEPAPGVARRSKQHSAYRSRLRRNRRTQLQSDDDGDGTTIAMANVYKEALAQSEL